MKNKVLIWNDYVLEHKGGPAGYLYNLREFIKENKIENIEFFNNDLPEIKKEIKKEKKFIYIHKILKKIRDKRKLKKRIKNLIEKKEEKYKKDILNIDDYDIIHFHEVGSLYKALDLLENYKGKILLTSHCPKAPSLEDIEDNLQSTKEKIGEENITRLENIEIKAFKRADYLVFPCEEAMEPYLEEEHLKIIINKKKEEHKILYIPTGIPEKYIEKNKNFYNDKNINKEDFIISYIGRHNEVKGYNFLLKLGEKILENYNNVTFIIGGALNEKIKPLNNKKWIEYGWTNKSFEIIKNSDLFILPNKKTYFDLIFLEVLSMGCPMVVSDTGGNKYFKKFPEKSIEFYEKNNIEEAYKKFKKIYKIWENKKLDEERRKNEILFKENFTLNTFGKNYIEMIEGL